MPFQLVTSLFFGSDNEGGRRADSRAGRGEGSELLSRGRSSSFLPVSELLSQSATQQNQLLPAMPWGVHPFLVRRKYSFQGQSSGYTITLSRW